MRSVALGASAPISHRRVDMSVHGRCSGGVIGVRVLVKRTG